MALAGDIILAVCRYPWGIGLDAYLRLNQRLPRRIGVAIMAKVMMFTTRIYNGEETRTFMEHVHRLKAIWDKEQTGNKRE